MNDKLYGVHWNSHKKCWSVVNFKSRKTIALLDSHKSELILSNVSFKVELSKKRKAIEKGTKDRHTFIVGNLDDSISFTIGERIHYDRHDNVQPFKDSHGHSLIGKSLYFSKEGIVYKINT